jgi:GDP-L-fucose synthase
MNTTERAEQKSNFFAGKRVVVTGGAGFLGHVVARKLREHGCREIFIPRRATCDLTRWDCVTRMLDEAKPDFLLHLAATVDNPAGRGNAAASFCNNVLMSTQLMEAACQRGIEKMVCLGSASSYPANAPIPLREQDLFTGLPEPTRAAHGIAKRLPLIHAQACRRQYGFRCIFLIPTNFYGPGDNVDPETCYVIPSFVRKFVEAAESHAAEVVMRGTGRATRDFLHVDDCAEGILLALEKYDGAEAVNLGSGIEVRIGELALEIAALAGYAGRIVWDANYPDGSVRRVLDIARAQREFGFRPRISLQEGLRGTVKWCCETRGWRATQAEKEKQSSDVHENLGRTNRDTRNGTTGSYSSERENAHDLPVVQ